MPRTPCRPGRRDNVDAVRTAALGLTLLAAYLCTAPASAQPGEGPVLSPDTHIEIAPTPESPATTSTLPTPPPEAPPPRPRKKGLVLESMLGVMGFGGQFRHVAPTGYWMHATLGYEVLNWLMLFGEGELALTDTSESQDASHSQAFPIWGAGGGLRATIHPSDRVAFFFQGDLGALTADVPQGSLAILGFPNAESLNVQFGGRAGIEWYQLDRHLALAAQGGVRDATGFAKQGRADTPLMWDAGAGLRYTF